MQILDRIKFKDAIFIPLVGLMFGSILSSLTTFFAYRADVIQNMSAWLQGDFSMIMKGRFELLYISIPVLILAYLYANRFTVAGMGEDFSKNLGLAYRRVVNIGLNTCCTYYDNSRFDSWDDSVSWFNHSKYRLYISRRPLTKDVAAYCVTRSDIPTHL